MVSRKGCLNPLVEGFCTGFLSCLVSDNKGLFEGVPDNCWKRFGNVVKNFLTSFNRVLFEEVGGVKGFGTAHVSVTLRITI